MPQKHALIVGGLGVIGRGIIDYLENDADWHLSAVSRRAPDFETRTQFVSVDLSNAKSSQEALASLSDVTHIFYAAYQERHDLHEQVAPNLRLLRNSVEAIEAAGAPLERVVLAQGGKAYGVHLGPFKTPAKETDPRHLPPNFYYDQEDYLRGRLAAGASWSFATLRPEAVIGFAIGNPMNLAMVIGVYAAICRELDAPFDFPGLQGAYDALYQVTDAQVLGAAFAWAGTTDAARNEVFNVTNGDLFRWRNLWPRLADHFGLARGQVRPISLTEFMADKADVWDRIVAREGLAPLPFEKAAAWAFGDFVFRCDWDIISDVQKGRRAGFDAMTLDTEARFVEVFRELAEHNVLPTMSSSAQTDQLTTMERTKFATGVLHH